MNWCEVMNMWCSDMDEEDVENCNCDGDCECCGFCTDIKPQESEDNK